VNDPFRAAVERAFVVEREGWAAERVARIDERLQRDATERFETIVVWLDDHSAFTLPGTTVYFSRRLLERMPDDDAAALVIAHEIAHHRLGHVPRVSKRFLALLPIRVVISLLERWITGSEHEADADLLAIEMCIDAGYDVERCLQALEQCAMIDLDYGDIDGAFGHEDGTHRAHPPTFARIASRVPTRSACSSRASASRSTSTPGAANAAAASRSPPAPPPRLSPCSCSAGADRDSSYRSVQRLPGRPT
jgi:predicted Zn-dependent protease